MNCNLFVYCCSLSPLQWGWSACFPSRPSQPQIYLLILAFNSVCKSWPARISLSVGLVRENTATKWREPLVCEPVNFWSFFRSSLSPRRPNKEEYPESWRSGLPLWTSISPAGQRPYTHSHSSGLWRVNSDWGPINETLGVLKGPLNWGGLFSFACFG